jgi:hypothetical protein
MVQGSENFIGFLVLEPSVVLQGRSRFATPF